MDLVVFENNKHYIIDEFREGRFDYIELASNVAETKFFRFFFDQGIYRQQCFGYFTLLEHTELTLSLEGKARRQALAKTRRWQQEVSAS